MRPRTISALPTRRRSRAPVLIWSANSEAEDADRDGGDDEVPAEAGVEVLTAAPVPQRRQPGGGDAPQVPPEVEDDGGHRPELDDGGERGARVRPVEERGNDPEVTAGGDRQELGEALDDAEDDRFEDRHRFSGLRAWRWVASWRGIVIVSGGRAGRRCRPRTVERTPCHPRSPRGHRPVRVRRQSALVDGTIRGRQGLGSVPVVATDAAGPEAGEEAGGVHEVGDLRVGRAERVGHVGVAAGADGDAVLGSRPPGPGG